MNNSEKTMEKIVALCKGRGFVYSGSEIYGGLANTWDYGPLGVEFKNNVKAAWRKKFVQESPYNVGLDSAILMNPMTWVASGHVGGFSEPEYTKPRPLHRATIFSIVFSLLFIFNLLLAQLAAARSFLPDQMKKVLT